MVFPGFIGPSYTSLSVNADAQRCLNMYLEVIESGVGKNKLALYGTPGLSLFNILPQAPVRGLWYGDGRLFAVAGNGANTTLYEVNSAGGIVSVRGTMPADNGDGTQVQMFASVAQSSESPGTVLWVVTGGATYYDTGTSLIRPTYASGGYVNATMGAYVDGYFIAQVPNSNFLQISPAFDSVGSWDKLQSFSKAGAPDRLIGILGDKEELLLFGQLTAEVWRNTGNGFNGFAFEKDPSGTMQMGIAARRSAVSINQGIAWIAQDQRGRGTAVFAKGYQPNRISTHAVEVAWSAYSTLSDAEAYAYEENGHKFWVIHFPAGNATWVWDATASEQLGQPIWHERAYNGSSHRQRQHCHAFAFEKHLVGDYLTGAIWQQNLGTYTDNGVAITRIRTCPHFSTENLRTFGHQIEIEMEVGNGTVSPTLAWSDDRGHTYGSEHSGRLQTKASPYIMTGPSPTPYAQRVILDRLGYWRDRIFRLTISDNQKIALINAYIKATQGTS